MDINMEACPPISMEALIQALIPPMVREEIAGDLRERYRSPIQYLCDAFSLLPALWLSQIRRGSSLYMLGLQAFILFACLGGFAIENIHPPLWARAAIPSLAALVGLTMRDIYRASDHPTIKTALADAAVALACAVSAELALAAWAPKFLLEPMRDVIGVLALQTLSVLRVGSFLEDVQPASLSADYRQFRQRIRWRNGFEAGFLVLFMPLAAFILARAKPGLVPTLGWMMLCGYLVVFCYLTARGWAKPLPAALSDGQLRLLYQTELKRQNRIRKAMWWIWLVPLFVGLITNYILRGVQEARPALVLFGIGLIALLAICIVGLNRIRGTGVWRKITLLEA
jgi:hypothetical protein